MRFWEFVSKTNTSSAILVPESVSFYRAPHGSPATSFPSPTRLPPASPCWGDGHRRRGRFVEHLLGHGVVESDRELLNRNREPHKVALAGAPTGWEAMRLAGSERRTDLLPLARTSFPLMPKAAVGLLCA